MRKLKQLCKVFAPVLFVLGATFLNTGPTQADPSPGITPQSPQPGAAPQPPQNLMPLSEIKPNPVDYHELADRKISISVKNGNFVDFLDAISKALPHVNFSLSGHQISKFQVTLEVTDMPLKYVLRAVAAFGNCDFYIFLDHFYICPPDKLSPAEKKALLDVVQSGTNEMSKKGEPVAPQ